MEEVSQRITLSREAPRISRSLVARLQPSLATRLEDVQLVVSELVSNSVRHARNTRHVEILIRTSDNVVRLEVSDSGDGFDTDRRRGDGMGLKIVERLADKWGVVLNEGCTVWVEMSLDEAVSA